MMKIPTEIPRRKKDNIPTFSKYSGIRNKEGMPYPEPKFPVITMNRKIQDRSKR
jgi:hypothetical protein